MKSGRKAKTVKDYECEATRVGKCLIHPNKGSFCEWEKRFADEAKLAAHTALMRSPEEREKRSKAAFAQHARRKKGKT